MRGLIVALPPGPCALCTRSRVSLDDVLPWTRKLAPPRELVKHVASYSSKQTVRRMLALLSCVEVISCGFPGHPPHTAGRVTATSHFWPGRAAARQTSPVAALYCS